MVLIVRVVHLDQELPSFSFLVLRKTSLYLFQPCFVILIEGLILESVEKLYLLLGIRDRLRIDISNFLLSGNKLGLEMLRLLYIGEEVSGVQLVATRAL